MLGLADRGRIFDLLEHLVGGRAAEALTALAALHRDGAEPAQVLADLAEALHIAARVKVLGPEPAGEGLSAEEKRRAAALGSSLSMALLARAWQMLIKGLEDAGRAPDPLAAAEMVLIRIAYTADLPPPDEIIKALGGGDGRLARAAPSGGGAAPAQRRADATVSKLEASERAAGEPAGETRAERADEYEFAADDMSDAAYPPSVVAPATALGSFADVVVLAGLNRDARLKVHLEEHVSLVRFDAAGAIDLHLLPGAPPEMANDLREKLNRWTGRRWLVVLSPSPGGQAIGPARREAEAAEIRSLKSHPAVAAVLEAFPDAEVAAVRPIAGKRDDETGTG